MTTEPREAPPEPGQRYYHQCRDWAIARGSESGFWVPWVTLEPGERQKWASHEQAMGQRQRAQKAAKE